MQEENGDIPNNKRSNNSPGHIPADNCKKSINPFLENTEKPTGIKICPCPIYITNTIIDINRLGDHRFLFLKTKQIYSLLISTNQKLRQKKLF